MAGAEFRKSSYSGGGGNECVEVAHVRTWACVRDSKLMNGPAVAVPASAFAAVIDAVRSGTL
ncbi:DUF397 domain-containing protein [Streptomyces chryseus]|nr:DUF397 domain-containing protein [Streptomyces chryseus]